jgi:hypothetical protein
MALQRRTPRADPVRHRDRDGRLHARAPHQHPVAEGRRTRPSSTRGQRRQPVFKNGQAPGQSRSISPLSTTSWLVAPTCTCRPMRLPRRRPATAERNPGTTTPSRFGRGPAGWRRPARSGARQPRQSPRPRQPGITPAAASALRQRHLEREHRLELGRHGKQRSHRLVAEQAGQIGVVEGRNGHGALFSRCGSLFGVDRRVEPADDGAEGTSRTS